MKAKLTLVTFFIAANSFSTLWVSVWLTLRLPPLFWLASCFCLFFSQNVNLKICHTCNSVRCNHLNLLSATIGEPIVAVVFMSTLPRSIDTDQDMPETIAATQPHQRPAPIESWWQRENRTSEPCLMCVASETEKTRGRRQRYFTICLHRHLANTQSNYCFHVSVYRYGVMYKAKKIQINSVICSFTFTAT